MPVPLTQMIGRGVEWASEAERALMATTDDPEAGKRARPVPAPAPAPTPAPTLSGRFLIRLSENGYLGNRYAPENFEHMAEKISLRYVEIRGLFGFRCT